MKLAEYAPRVVAMAEQVGPDRHAIGTALGMTFRQLDKCINSHCRETYKAAVARWDARRLNEVEVPAAPWPAPPRICDVLTLPPHDFAVPIPEALPQPFPMGTTAIWTCDWHLPFEDRAAIRCALAVAHALQPDHFILGGDGLDCWQISNFDKNPDRMDRLQDSINALRIDLHQIRQLCPTAICTYLEGNHEARLTKLLWGLEGAARELPRLDDIREAATWPHLLRLNDIGWRWVGVREQSRADVLPRIICKHGDVVRKHSGWTARAESERYSRATVSGHTHRLGAYYVRDANGVVQAWEGGCLCSLEQEYCVDPNWQQGFLVYSWSADLALMSVEPVSIRDGRCVWRGHEYDGNAAVALAEAA